MEILEARVIQKVGTEAEWLANPLPLLDGEAAIVRTGDGTPVNLKFGDGGKTFAELPYFIDYSQAAYIEISSNALPTPTQEVGYGFSNEGTYTFGASSYTVPAGHWGMFSWNGTTWSLKDMGELPQISPTANVNTGDNQALSGNTAFISINPLDEVNKELSNESIPLTFFNGVLTVENTVNPSSNNKVAQNIIIEAGSKVIYEAIRGVTGSLPTTAVSMIAIDGTNNVLAVELYNKLITDPDVRERHEFEMPEGTVYASMSVRAYDNNARLYYNRPYITNSQLVESEKIGNRFIDIDRLGSKSVIDNDNKTLGRWLIRSTRSSVVFDDTYFKITSTTINGGLLYPLFFKDSDIGKEFIFEFTAKSTDPVDLLIYANNSTPVRMSVNGTGKRYCSGFVCGSSYIDRRLLLGLEAGAEVEIKDLKMYTVESLEAGFEREFSALPRTKYKTKSLLSGGTTTVLNVGLSGDSWTQSVPGAINYVRTLSKLLKSRYGDGGAGFYDFSRSGASDYMRSADIDDATDTRSGSITYKDQSSDSLGLNYAHAEFGNGSTLTLNILKPQQSATIHFYGGGGTFTYKIGSASPVSVNTSSLTGYQTVNIVLNNEVEDIVFSVVSGTCIIFGIDLKRTYGVRVHKLGNRGLRAYDTLAINDANWKLGLSRLNLDFFSILIGTNDKTDGKLCGDIKNSVRTILRRVGEVDTNIDRLIISPSNNVNSVLSDYNRTLLSLSKDLDIPFLSTVQLFGSQSQINSLSSFFDTYHPTSVGGDMIADFIYRKIFTIDE